MSTNEALGEALAMIAQAAAGAVDPWWIIGSAALSLHGADISDIKDVDLLMSARDAEALLRIVGETKCADASTRFRSQVFGLWNRPPIPVEVFGGFSIAAAGGWREVVLATREPVPTTAGQVYIPAKGEMVRVLQSSVGPRT